MAYEVHANLAWGFVIPEEPRITVSGGGVTIETAGPDDYPQYVVAVYESLMSTDSSSCLQLPPLSVDRRWLGLVEKFCNANGIPVQDPGWVLYYFFTWR